MTKLCNACENCWVFFSFYNYSWHLKCSLPVPTFLHPLPLYFFLILAQILIWSLSNIFVGKFSVIYSWPYRIAGNRKLMYIYIAVLTLIFFYVCRGHRCSPVFSFCLNKQISKVYFKYHKKNNNYSWFSYQLCFAAIGIINFSKKPQYFIFASGTQSSCTSISCIHCSNRPVSSCTAICVYLST